MVKVLDEDCRERFIEREEGMSERVCLERWLIGPFLTPQA